MLKNYDGLNSLYDTVKNNIKREDTITLDKKLKYANKLFGNRAIFKPIKKQIALNVKINEIEDKLDGTFSVKCAGRVNRLMEEVKQSNIKLKKYMTENEILKSSIYEQKSEESEEVKELKENIFRLQSLYDASGVKNSEITELKEHIKKITDELEQNANNTEQYDSKSEINDLKEKLTKLIDLNTNTNLSLQENLKIESELKENLKKVIDLSNSNNLIYSQNNVEKLNEYAQNDASVLEVLKNINLNNPYKGLNDLNKLLGSKDTINSNEIIHLNDLFNSLENVSEKQNKRVKLNEYGNFKLNLKNEKNEFNINEVIKENLQLKELLNEALTKLKYDKNSSINTDPQNNLATLLGNENYMKSLFDIPRSDNLNFLNEKLYNPSEFYSSHFLKSRFESQPKNPSDLALRVFKENFFLNKRLLNERERIKNEQIDKIKRNYEKIIDTLISKDSSKNIKLLYELKSLDPNDPNIENVLDKISKDAN